jgi:hypothetical protein
MPLVLAHGVGSRGDLPLPRSLFIWGAVLALLVSFAAVGVLWSTPRLAEAARAGRVWRPPRWLALSAEWALRVVALAVYVVTVVAAFAGPGPGANVAPYAVFVALWVGVPVVSAVAGDVWRFANPLDTIGIVVERLGPARRRRRPQDVTRSAEEPTVEASAAEEAAAEREPSALAASYWPAVAGLLAFHWLELAYHDPASPRTIGWLVVAYSALVLAAVAWYGRVWLRTGDGFAVLFGLIAAISPVGRAGDGRLRFRMPLSGLTEIRNGPGLVMVVMVTLGGTSFDGLSRTRFWVTQFAGERTGWELTLVSTLGLLWTIGVVTALYLGATKLAERVAETDLDLGAVLLPSMVPIAFGYALAHYFSLLVLDGGQNFLILLADPLGEGWDLLGTAQWRVNFLLVSTTAIAWVQAAGIVAGHVSGVLVAHDRALDTMPADQAIRAQYPVLAAMIVYTVGGLMLLLGA